MFSPIRLLLLTLALLPVTGVARPTLSLAGSWRFQLDRGDRGVGEAWFARALTGSITLPGTLPGQGIGDPVGLDTLWMGSIFDKSFFTDPAYAPYREPDNFKVPFWLQPTHYYAGVAWFQRTVEIPADWAGRSVHLTLERPHWETRVWIDGRAVGQDRSLSTPHVYLLGDDLQPGPHVVTVRVDNRRIVEIGENSHSISDHTQGNWNGIVGRLELSATPATWIDDLQVYPQVATRGVRVAGTVAGRPGASPAQAIEITVQSPGAAAPRPPLRLAISADGSFAGELALGPDAALWDEFSPVLHRLQAQLANGDDHSVDFGLREIATAGTQFALNGRLLFIRGTLECAIFPKTGHPPTDVESWRRILRIARSHGLNSLRFHSWCPPDAAFVAGDELGFYFQVEAASWPNQSTTLGDGKPVDAWLEEETTRILRAYGNHPSFLLMASGNEPGGKQRDAYLSAWLTRHRPRDPRRLFTSASGWPELPENAYHVSPGPRMHQWQDNLKSRINARPPETITDYRGYISARSVPVVSHEIGQWCVFPDFAEMAAYTGYLKPRNFEIFQELLAKNHLADQARAFVQASGKLQALCYKEEIESALRTPGMGGFQLLDLHDFPGQGTALVGVLNPFWESKGYITPEAFRRFCNQTVPLARLARRVFTTDETLSATLEVAHFGPALLTAATVSWRLVGDDGQVVAGAKGAAVDLPVGNVTPVGTVALSLQSVPAPARYRLVVGIDGTPFENDWDVWVYPPKTAPVTPPHVTVTTSVDDALSALAQGRTVFLTLPSAEVRNDGPKPVQLGFSSIFWNTAWTNGQAPSTLGILCDPAHPALAAFPTDAYSNWQWWYLVSRATPLRLDGLPATLRPVVQVIDDWFTSRRLGLVVEARVGPGRLLVSSIDWTDENPVSRQLYASLLSHVADKRFAPVATLNPADVAAWVRR